MPPLPPHLLEAMKAAAIEVGHQALAHKKAGLSIQYKPDHSLVTEADKQGEAIIHRHLDGFGFDFLGEETGQTLSGSDFSFIVDPIDGTTNYTTGDPNWMVSIGLSYKGEPVAGVTYQPDLDKLFWAEKGQGAFLQQNSQTRKLDVRTREPGAYVFDISSSRPAFMETARLQQALREEVLHTTERRYAARYRSGGCPSASLCQIAEGGRAGAIYWPVSLWDVSAATLIAQEAGVQLSLSKENPADTSPGAFYQLVSAIPSMYQAAQHAFDTAFGKQAHFYLGAHQTDMKSSLAADGIRYGVSVGRRQPMHQMHLDCVREIIDAGLHAVVVIGSANNPKNPYFNVLSNPLSESQQREQITQALTQVGIAPDRYTLLAVPDLGSMDEWAASIRYLLKANGFDPQASVFHYRSKSSDLEQSSQAIKPLRASHESLMRHGMSVWESFNRTIENDDMSATPFRTLDLQDPAHKPLCDATLVAPDYIRELAVQARAANPDKSLLDNLPVTLLDLSLDRLANEAGIRTADVLAGNPATSLDALSHAIKHWQNAPRTTISGAIALSSQAQALRR